MFSQKSKPKRSLVVSALVAILLVTTLGPAWLVQAQSASVTIYDDRLASGWQDWSWNTSRDLNTTRIKQSGTASITVQINQAWGALYLHHNSGLSTSGYTHLEFYIHGGKTGKQNVSLVTNNNGKDYKLTFVKNTWTKVSIPLTALGSPASIIDLYWQDKGGTVQPRFYIDSIRLVTNGGASTAVPTATRTPGATSTPVVSPTQTPVSTTHFSTLLPGSSLPSDAECASAVRSRPENKGVNVDYNATRGDQALPSDYLTGGDPRANTEIMSRVTGNFSGTTDEILQWVACKWGIDEDIVRAQAAVESWWRQDTLGDWTTDASRCAPGHGLGVDGRPGQCPESFGIMQNRYPYGEGAWPGIAESTAFNADVAYGVWRACYEGYEWWLNHVERGEQYDKGDAWGCVGRWFAGRWHTQPAHDYIAHVQDYLNRRIWEIPEFQQP